MLSYSTALCLFETHAWEVHFVLNIYIARSHFVHVNVLLPTVKRCELRMSSMHSVQTQRLRVKLFQIDFSENNLQNISCTYGSRFCAHVLHEDAAKQLQRKPPAAQQHVVRDHHPHKTTVWTGGNKQETSSSYRSQPLMNL